MNMIERIARALVKRNYPSFTDADIDAMWEGWAEDAATAVQAMRDPTPEMVEAAAPMPKRRAGVPAMIAATALDQIVAKQTWQAMIDAALIDASPIDTYETKADVAPVTDADRELATAIRIALYRACPGMPSYPDNIVPQVIAAHRATYEMEPIDTSFGVGEG